MTEYLYAGCATLILFISLLVIGKKEKGLSDYIFLAWLFILLLDIATFIIIRRFNYPSDFWGRLLVEFSEASVFLHGPIFLFYTFSLSSSHFKLGKRQLLHILPFMTYMALLIYGIQRKDGVSTNTRQSFTVIKMISLLIYTSIVLIQLRKHRNQVERIFSNTESKYLGWLQFLAWGIIIVWVISAAGLLLYNIYGIEIPQYGSLAGNLALCGLIFLIGYFGVRQEAIFNFVKKSEFSILKEELIPTIEQNDSIEKDNTTGTIIDDFTNDNSSFDKYKNSGLSKEKSLSLFEELETLMNTKKPYQDAELTLFSLAKLAGLHPNHLSQIINQHNNQNFFDFINEYRVNDVKEALNSGNYENHSLLGIAYEFGFNSKASFNRAFKKFTGMTPSEYKKISGAN